MFPFYAAIIFYPAAIFSVLTHIYAARRVKKLSAIDTTPVIPVMFWSLIVMAVNCAAMALGMALPMGGLRDAVLWLVALSQAAMAVKCWMLANKLDAL